MTMNKFLAGATAWGLLALSLTPLFITDTMFFPFITGKNFFFRIVVEVVFALWLVLMLREPAYRPKRSWILYLYTALAVIMTLATIFGANPSISFWSNFERMEGLLGHLHLFVFFLVLGSIYTTPELWRRFFGAMAGTSAMVVSYAIFQLLDIIIIQQGGVRVDGTLGNATYFAGYLLFHFFFLLYYLRKDSVEYMARWIVGGIAASGVYLSYMLSDLPQRPIGRIFVVFLIAAILAAALYFDKKRRVAWFVSGGFAAVYLWLIIASATRGAIIGLAAGLLVTLALLALKGEGGKQKIAALYLATLLLAGGTLFGLAQTEFGRGNQVLVRFGAKTLTDTFLTRSTIWGMALSGAMEHPLIGWGPESFIIMFNKYYEPSLYGQEPWFDRAHNIFLDWLVGTGLLGLAAYLGLYVSAFYYLWKKTHLSVAGKSIFTGLLTAHIFQNFTVFDQITSYLLFFSVLSFVHSHAAMSRAKEVEAAAATPRRLPEWVEQTMAGIVLLAVIFSLYFFNVRHVRAARLLAQAINTTRNGRDNLQDFKKVIGYGGIGLTEGREHMMQFGAQVIMRADRFDPEIRNDFFMTVREEMQKEIARQPQNARQVLFLGSFLTTVGQYADGLTFLEKAQELSPKKQAIMFERASALIGLKRYDEVFVVLKQAYELDPNYEIAKRLYMVGAVYAGKDEIARELAGGKLPYDQRILSAYVNTGQFAKASTQLEMFVADEPANPQAHISLAIAYTHIGRRTDAIRELRKAKELDPNLASQIDQAIREIQAARNPFKAN